MAAQKEKYYVYDIRRIDTGEILYIGQTGDIERRKKEHMRGKTNTSEILEEVGFDNVKIVVDMIVPSLKSAHNYENDLIEMFETRSKGNKQGSGNSSLDKIQYHRDWIDSHKGKSSEYNRRYYLKNKEAILQRQKRHRELRRVEAS